MLSLAEFEKLDLDGRWNLVVPTTKGSIQDKSIKRVQPYCIGLLYCNIPFPHCPAPVQGTRIILSHENVYDGTLHIEKSDAGGPRVEMTWKGYITQVYDGDFRMRPVNQKASTIAGVCDGIAFKFNGTHLEFGVWPLFLELYEG